MKQVNCYLCGSSKSEVLFKQQGHDPYLAKVYEKPPEEDMNWRICTDCGFVYRSPALDDRELDTLYKKYDHDVMKNTTPDAYFNKIVGLPKEESENWQKSLWLTNVIQKCRSNKEAFNVLDVGCGGGTLVHTLGDCLNISKLCGVELNPIYADLAQKRLDADIRNQNYVNGLFDYKFDLIINTKVLEHVSDPIPFLEEIVKDLADDGLLFLEVPDLSDIFVLPPSHSRFFIPHIYYYSENTLEAMLGKVGMGVIESRVITTSRDRAYLQIVASKNRSIIENDSLPYDDPEIVIPKVAQNMGKYDN